MTHTFRNRPNRKLELDNGETVWISRSCAVVAEVLLFQCDSKEWYVLLGKRGNNVPDYKNCWGLPCGYLDWDETTYEAFLREVWEETSLYLPELLKSSNCSSCTGIVERGASSYPAACKISERSTGPTQNISFHFKAIVHWSSDSLPKLGIENAEEGEATEANWIKLSEAIDMDLAFSHSNRLREIRDEIFLHDSTLAVNKFQKSD